jgi:hypothetical protein
MMKKPKDLALAEVAFNAFYDERPPVFFDDLNQNAQMKWVRIIRAVVKDYKSIPKGGNTSNHPGSGSGSISQEEKRRRDRERKQAKRQGMARENGHDNSVSRKSNQGLSLVEKEADWAMKDQKDLAKMTDRPWKEKAPGERKAFHRMNYRNLQRRKYGLPLVELPSQTGR